MDTNNQATTYRINDKVTLDGHSGVVVASYKEGRLITISFDEPRVPVMIGVTHSGLAKA